MTVKLRVARNHVSCSWVRRGNQPGNSRLLPTSKTTGRSGIRISDLSGDRHLIYLTTDDHGRSSKRATAVGGGFLAFTVLYCTHYEGFKVRHPQSGRKSEQSNQETEKWPSRSVSQTNKVTDRRLDKDENETPTGKENSRKKLMFN